jgi:hypothetical protein
MLVEVASSVSVTGMLVVAVASRNVVISVPTTVVRVVNSVAVTKSYTTVVAVASTSSVEVEKSVVVPSTSKKVV